LLVLLRSTLQHIATCESFIVCVCSGFLHSHSLDALRYQFITSQLFCGTISRCCKDLTTRMSRGVTASMCRVPRARPVSLSCAACFLALTDLYMPLLFLSGLSVGLCTASHVHGVWSIVFGLHLVSGTCMSTSCRCIRLCLCSIRFSDQVVCLILA
jgi:hypothetical protein